MTGPNDTITTLRWCAGAQAIIGIDRIAVIAGFSLLNHPIAATRRLTVVARVGGIVVAVITPLAGPKHAVTAARLLAVR